MEGVPSAFWGKLESRDLHVAAWHPLEAHCADVAACAEALLTRTLLRKRLARLGGLDDLDHAQVARLCVLAALHDLGKFNQHFQNKGRPDAQPLGGHVHEVTMLFAQSDRSEVRALMAALPLDALATWTRTPETTLELLIAAISHHGRPAPIEGSGLQHDPRRWAVAHGLDPFAGIRALCTWARRWFPAAWGSGRPLPETPAFQHAFSGLVMLADWLGSDTEFFPFATTGDDRLPFARDAALRAVRAVHLDVDAGRLALGSAPMQFDRIAPFAPNEAQQTTLALSIHTDGSLTVLESETGSGKTEAAVARFVQMFQAGAVDGMYFAVPTRTAATQIHARVTAALERAFPDLATRPPVVLAVPGYLQVDDEKGHPLPNFEVLWNDDPRRAKRHRGWAAEHPKRFLAASIAIGTIDQVLLSALTVDHAHLRSTALLRQLLVVDEVHASDAYMTRLLEEVLRTHLAAGGHTLLMSATLGSAARDRLFALGRSFTPTLLDAAVATPYPLLSHAATPAPAICFPVSAPGNPRRVTLQTDASIGDARHVARTALDHASRGARVLVLRNTVRDCLDTQRALEAIAAAEGRTGLLFTCAGVPAPHHSRFTRDDRRALDDAIERRYGKSSPTGGCVIVATQTVQQALDLDADLLLTDLCPMDVLLQRIGRLHRHDRQGVQERPNGYASPVAVVLTPTDRDLSAMIKKAGEPRGKHGHGTVYDDLRVLEATWCQIMQHSDVVIPAMNRHLVEHTTHSAVLDAIGRRDAKWSQHQMWVTGQLFGDRRAAAFNLIARDEPFGFARFPDKELGRRISTRLGEGDRRIELPSSVLGPFGATVRVFTVPAFQAREIQPDAVATVLDATDEMIRFAVGPTRFLYDRLGLRPNRKSTRLNSSHITLSRMPSSG